MQTVEISKATRRAIEAAFKPRPRWNQIHNGMTWRDMPSHSQNDTVERKLNFALYRMGRLGAEEMGFVERKRARLGLK